MLKVCICPLPSLQLKFPGRSYLPAWTALDSTGQLIASCVACVILCHPVSSCVLGSPMAWRRGIRGIPDMHCVVHTAHPEEIPGTTHISWFYMILMCNWHASHTQEFHLADKMKSWNHEIMTDNESKWSNPVSPWQLRAEMDADARFRYVQFHVISSLKPAPS